MALWYSNLKVHMSGQPIRGVAQKRKCHFAWFEKLPKGSLNETHAGRAVGKEKPTHFWARLTSAMGSSLATLSHPPTLSRPWGPTP